MHKGSCLCGSVKFFFNDSVGAFVFCHCRSCRKASGSAFAANISVPIDDFTLIEGSQNIGVFESSPNKFRHFCAICGSPLYTKVGDNPAMVRVRLGTLDTEFNKQPSAHIFMSHKAGWDEPAAEIQCFGEWPSKEAVEISGSHQPVS